MSACVSTPRSRVRQCFYEYLGVAAALLVLLPAQGRQVIWRAFGEVSLRLKVREGLGRDRQQLFQAELTGPVLDELNEFSPNPLILVGGAHVEAGQLALVLLGVDVQGDAGDGIPV